MFQASENQQYSCIDLLRHGECEGGNIFRGTKDVGLSAVGTAQMQKTVNSLQANWDAVLSSPLKRCRIFAENFAIQKEMSWQGYDCLKEMSFGDWEGRDIEQVWQDDQDKMLAWRENPAINTPPGGEPLVQVAERAQQALTLIQHEYAGKNLLVVTHGGFIRVLLSVVLQAPLSSAGCWHIPYAGLVRLHLYKLGENWRWQIEIQP